MKESYELDIGFAELRKQKRWLETVATLNRQEVEGLLCLLDGIQDIACKNGYGHDLEIFGYIPKDPQEDNDAPPAVYFKTDSARNKVVALVLYHSRAAGVEFYINGRCKVKSVTSKSQFEGDFFGYGSGDEDATQNEYMTTLSMLCEMGLPSNISILTGDLPTGPNFSAEVDIVAEVS